MLKAIDKTVDDWFNMSKIDTLEEFVKSSIEAAVENNIDIDNIIISEDDKEIDIDIEKEMEKYEYFLIFQNKDYIYFRDIEDAKTFMSCRENVNLLLCKTENELFKYCNTFE